MVKKLSQIDLSVKSNRKYHRILQHMNSRMVHSRRRAKSRFNVTLSELDYFRLVEQILNEQAQYLRPTEMPGRYLYKVLFQGVAMIAVYEPAYAMICTFLTEDMI